MTLRVSGPTLRVSGLFVYPIKSCAGIGLEQALLESRGLRHDRRWLVVDPDGRFLTQRQEPRLALLRPRIEDDGIVVEGPDREPLRLRPAEGERLESTVWRSQVDAACATPEADTWISSFLGRPLRLVHMDAAAERRVQSDGAGPEREVSFADELALLITGQASLEDLCERLGEPVPMERFRPNLVVAGAPSFAEDGWQRIAVSEVEIELVKPAARCSVVTVDQRTAARDPRNEPLRTLATFRRTAVGGRSDPDGRVFFGVRAAPLTGGALAVGDEVRVLA